METETVYFIQNSIDPTTVKIGKSTKPEKRIKSGHTFAPNGIVTLLTITGAKGYEKELHNRFWKYHIDNNGGREWFHYSKEIQEFVKSNQPRRDVKVEMLEPLPTIKNSKMEYTEDYDKFHLGSNRPIDYKRVERFSQTIRSKNFLHLAPIVVSSDGWIIDGQHRFEAAKRLQVGFYYIVGEVTPQDVASMNKDTVKWRMEDYLAFYIELGKEHYKTLKKFVDTYPTVPLRTLIDYSMFGKWNRENITNDFKSGDYQCIAPQEVPTLASMYSDLMPLLGKYGSKNAIAGGIVRLKRNPVYNHHRMMEQIAKNPNLLKKFADSTQLLENLNSVYNANKKGSNRVWIINP